MIHSSNSPLNPKLLHHPYGITAVDTEYLHPGHAASHIIQDAGRAAFVDVGTNFSVPYLLAPLDDVGGRVPIPAAAVKLVKGGGRFRGGGRELELIHTPGHALHHYAVVDLAHSC